MNHHKAILGLTIINKQVVSRNLGQFIEFIQSIVFLCSEESNLNVGRLVHTVILHCDTLPQVVCCFFTCYIKDVKLLIHSWFFARFGFTYKFEFKVFSSMNNSFPHCWYLFSVVLSKIDSLGFFELSLFILLIHFRLKIRSPLVGFWDQANLRILVWFFFWKFNVIGTRVFSGTLITPLFNFYLGLGLRCTKTQRFVENTPHEIFNILLSLCFWC